MKVITVILLYFAITGCASMTNQVAPILDENLADPEKATIIVKRKVEQAGKAYEVEVYDGNTLIGYSGVARPQGRLNNWLIWEREPGEMSLAIKKPIFGMDDPIVTKVEAGKTYEYQVYYHFASGYELEKL